MFLFANVASQLKIIVACTLRLNQLSQRHLFQNSCLLGNTKRYVFVTASIVQSLLSLSFHFNIVIPHAVLFIVQVRVYLKKKQVQL